jgi:hypothetical protein
MEPYATVNKWVQELDIAEGLKQLLIDSGLTVESIIRLGSEELSEILHVDTYIGKLILEAAKNMMQESSSAFMHIYAVIMR